MIVTTTSIPTAAKRVDGHLRRTPEEREYFELTDSVDGEETRGMGGKDKDARIRDEEVGEERIWL